MVADPLQEIIGEAILDRGFRSALLRDPAAAVLRFELSDADRAALSSIRASSFEHFAAQVDQIRMRRDKPTVQHAWRELRDVAGLSFRAAG